MSATCIRRAGARVGTLAARASARNCPAMVALREQARALRLAHEVELIPGDWLTAEVGRAGRADSDEPGFGQ
jgi:hypothetical protein